MQKETQTLYIEMEEEMDIEIVVHIYGEGGEKVTGLLARD